MYKFEFTSAYFNLENNIWNNSIYNCDNYDESGRERHRYGEGEGVNQISWDILIDRWLCDLNPVWVLTLLPLHTYRHCCCRQWQWFGFPFSFLDWFLVFISFLDCLLQSVFVVASCICIIPLFKSTIQQIQNNSCTERMIGRAEMKQQEPTKIPLGYHFLR